MCPRSPKRSTRQLWSYQYNVKIVGVPQAEGTSKSAEDTVKKCLVIFSGIGANKKSNGRGRATGGPFPIICKFTRRIARDGGLSKRRKTRRLLSESFDLQEDSELSIKIYTHLTPRLQELLHDAKSLQKSHAFKYCKSKDSMILLRKTDNSRIYKRRNLEDLEELRLSLNRPTEE